MSTVLEAHNINEYFEKPTRFHVLKDINFKIEKGEFVSIMGKSGSGKSTLLYILSTMDTEYEGDLLLNNELISGQTSERLSYIRNKHIGFVFQFHYLLAEIEQDAYDKLKLLKIEHLALKKASQVSGGEKQRVAIARALINNPSIIMGDEPTGNLDSYNADNVFTIFRELCDKEHMSLLIVTHDEDFAKRTDRIIMMEDGAVLK